MESKLRLSGLAEESIVDGPGIRFTVFTQGCPHHCKGCHNPQTHDFSEGYDSTIEEIFEKFVENPLLSGITFSGGEPFCQPEPLYYLGLKVKELKKNIVVYTGYTLEQLKKLQENNPFIASLLSITDILIDGPYVEELRDLELQFRGSSNQRILYLDE
ncbi:MAG TPA: anaerobic ribonucleoside-triphosphate reductase activating protein [Candidatus Pelethocola excrementipullorum]|nr:anaerobic ribonucleoside-triphosphate reductase activating protein [Candidatus Pelethocola excrementipullorum]